MEAFSAFFSTFSFLRSALESFFDSVSVTGAAATLAAPEDGGGLNFEAGVSAGEVDLDPNERSFTSLMKFGESPRNGGPSCCCRP